MDKVSQSRSIGGLDSVDTRPEAWKILLGTCIESLSGAIGMVGPDYPPANYMPGAGEKPYPYTRAPMATRYRDFIAKRPVNFKNIKITGSTVLGNYINSYEMLHSFGAFVNPRNFVENQPNLPANTFQSVATSSTVVRTFLDTRPVRSYYLDTERFEFAQDYGVGYLTGTTNKSIIKTRFASPGGIEQSTPGYTAFRS